MQSLVRWTNRWDQWALMRCPLPWQLRLHWCLPAALLWCALVLGIWLQWMDHPARWLGSTPGVVAMDFHSAEEAALQIATVVAWLVSLGALMWWLLRVRVHNRWREHAPAGRLGVWWEYLWAALFLSLLLAPALTLPTVYDYRVQARWQGTDTQAQVQAARHVLALEALAAPGNAPLLVEWTLAAESESESDAHDGRTEPIQVLRWLMRGDEAALTALLQRYGAPLQALGYVRTGADSASQQARQMLSAYQAILQSPVAQDWRAYKARYANTPRAEQPDGEDTQAYYCLQSVRGHERRLHVDEDPRSCFAAYLRVERTAWLARLSMLDTTGVGTRSESTLPAPPQPLVQWTHPRHGVALAPLQRDHFQRATATADKLQSQRAQLWQALAMGLLIAPLLVLVRLMSPLQLAAWAAAMLLAMPCFMVLAMLGLGSPDTLWLAPAALLATALVRIVALRRPWAGSLLLGLSLALGLLWLLGAQVQWSSKLYAPYGDAGGGLAPWMYTLAQIAALPLGAALLVLILSPLWRRWRGLPGQ